MTWPGRAFYGQTLGCSEGRSSPEWIDFNFYGHQIVAHLAAGEAANDVCSDVDARKSRFDILGGALHGRVADLGGSSQGSGTQFIIEPTFGSRVRSVSRHHVFMDPLQCH